MNYQLPNSTPPGKGSGPQFMIAISLVILVLCLAGFGVFEVKKHPNVNEGFASLNTRISSWWVDRKQRLQKEMDSVKHVAQKGGHVTPVKTAKVKFEFYRALPDAATQLKPEQQIQQTIAMKAQEDILPKKITTPAEVKKKAVATKVNRQMKKVVAQVKKKIKKRHKKVHVAKKRKKTGKKTRYSKKTLRIINLRKQQQRKKYMLSRKKIDKKKVIKHKVARKVARKKTKKLKPVVVSSVADLEKDLLSTMRKTGRRKKS